MLSVEIQIQVLEMRATTKASARKIAAALCIGRAQAERVIRRGQVRRPVPPRKASEIVCEECGKPLPCIACARRLQQLRLAAERKLR